MFPISQAIVPITCVVLVPPPTPSPPDYQLDNLILMGIYVGLTLVVAIGAIWSIFITMASLKASSEQSQAALTASEKQSKAAIDAVHEQIVVSERQAREALSLAHEQIEQSKQPILIPLSALPLTAVVGQLDYTHSELPLSLMNVGTGVALNIWGVIVPPKTIHQTPYSFSNQAHLLQGKDDKVLFHMGQFLFFTENDKIGEYDLQPSSELTQVGTIDVLKYAARLTLTYIDVFGIKHATLYDYTNVNEWKVVAHFRVQHDLDDMYKDKQKQPTAP